MIHKTYVHLLKNSIGQQSGGNSNCSPAGPKKRQPGLAAAGSEGLSHKNRGGGACIYIYTLLCLRSQHNVNVILESFGGGHAASQ